ncbi:hypothetical protein RRG08_014205 [Elysia crispata]|uniref:Uncharacterized protein n=1 Tax=Elysia crispata TaxID=231223 RepID=A0AAE0Z2S8_9GAST|nr:hypothetical protein RRG08_014205 [Elysia crispata]
MLRRTYIRFLKALVRLERVVCPHYTNLLSISFRSSSLHHRTSCCPLYDPEMTCQDYTSGTWRTYHLPPSKFAPFVPSTLTLPAPMFCGPLDQL